MAGKTWQIVLAGTGGQGLILGGVTLAKAAVLEGKNAVQTQTYGIQSRGGYSQSEVVISEEDVYFPKCDRPDLVLALSQQGYERYRTIVADECIILYDQDVVKNTKRSHDVGYPFSTRVMDIGNVKAINSLFLGSVLKLCPVVSIESLTKVLEDSLPAKILAINLKALNIGYEEIG
ncbi:MAG TPA: 2-oxoacid:ferredoxin oxidoreductase subunit gamma [Desulfosporosinus sp.]|nr:2-oxoacid:ferredoxin oxidoreductase subunit gamma [Desulfosporosinus sp.]